MSDIETPESYPKYQSLLTRHRIGEGVEKDVTNRQGLIAQGHSEVFDYLLDEWTLPGSDGTTRAAAAHPLPANQPVIFVSGNIAALCPGGAVGLAATVDIDIKVSLFNRTSERMWAIVAHLYDHGTDEVKGLTGDRRTPGANHERAKVDADSIGSADVVVVPLEDGDRAETLGAVDRAGIVVNLNPMSRSAQVATVPIVDNVTCAVPNIATHAHDLRDSGTTREGLETIVANFDANAAFNATERAIRAGDE